MKKVIVLGNDHTNSLGIIQSLGKEGYYMIAFVWGLKTDILRCSKYLKEIHSGKNIDSCIAKILKYNIGEDEKIPIIACCDAAALALERNADKLRERFVFEHATNYTLAHLAKKENQVKYAYHAGRAQAFGLGGAHIIHGKRFKQGSSRQFSDNGKRTHAKCECRKDEVGQAEVFSPTEIVNGIKASRHVQASMFLQEETENPCHEDSCEKRWQRHAYSGDEKRQLVPEWLVDYGSHDAYQKAKNQCNGYGNRRQKQGVWESLAQNIRHFAFALIRHAQIRCLHHNGS